MLIESFSERQSRSEQKRRTILHFLRNEIWSNLSTLAALTGLSEAAMFKTLCQLEHGGYLLRHKVTQLRLSLWGITPKGLLFAWDADENMEPRPHFEPSKLAVVTIQHYLDTQRARLAAEAAGWSQWAPGNRLPKNTKKIPDAIAIAPNGYRIAVEIERSIKTLKRYESIFSLYLQAIKRDELTMVHYVCPDKEFAPRLRRMFSLITKVPIAGERIPITEKHRARFPVYSLENWPVDAGWVGNSIG